MRDRPDPRPFADIPDPFERDLGAPVRPMVRAPIASPARSRVRSLRAVAAAGAIAYELAWLAYSGLRPDLATVPPSALALALVAPLAASGIALLAVMRGGTVGLGEPAGRLAILLVAPPALFTLAALLSAPVGECDWNGAAGCMLKTAVLTVGPLALGAWALRRAFAAASVWRTAALGVACGALSAATMSLACAGTGAFHVLVGHGTMMLAGGLAGVMLGRRVTRA